MDYLTAFGEENKENIDPITGLPANMNRFKSLKQPLTTTRPPNGQQSPRRVRCAPSQSRQVSQQPNTNSQTNQAQKSEKTTRPTPPRSNLIRNLR